MDDVRAMQMQIDCMPLNQQKQAQPANQIPSLPIPIPENNLMKQQQNLKQLIEKQQQMLEQANMMSSFKNVYSG
jgi:hypothetical protein